MHCLVQEALVPKKKTKQNVDADTDADAERIISIQTHTKTLDHHISKNVS